jgi:hypothetical protein
MMFAIGEKVRYLDDVGEATIIKFIDGKTALVEDEYGLTHTHPIAKLVPAERHRVSEKPKLNIPQPIKTSVSAKPTPKPVQGAILPELFLAFVSSNENQPETGDFDLLFGNNSKYHLLLNVSAKVNEEWFSLYNGKVLPNNQQLIQSLRRQDIGSVGNLKVDVIFFGTTGYDYRSTISSTLKIKSTRFVKAGNYLRYEGLEDPAIVIEVQNDKGIKAPSATSKLARPAKIVKSASLVFEEEVDLHLEAILGTDPHDMPDHEKFLTQMRHFERRLTHALTHNYLEITFIHGVGKGRLKEAIRQELKEYGLPFQDGPFHKYGVGATVVNLNLV